MIVRVLDDPHKEDRAQGGTTGFPRTERVARIGILGRHHATESQSALHHATTCATCATCRSCGPDHWLDRQYRLGHDAGNDWVQLDGEARRRLASFPSPLACQLPVKEGTREEREEIFSTIFRTQFVAVGADKDVFQTGLWARGGRSRVASNEKNLVSLQDIPVWTDPGMIIFPLTAACANGTSSVTSSTDA